MQLVSLRQIVETNLGITLPKDNVSFHNSIMRAFRNVRIWGHPRVCNLKVCSNLTNSNKLKIKSLFTRCIDFFLDGIIFNYYIVVYIYRQKAFF